MDMDSVYQAAKYFACGAAATYAFMKAYKALFGPTLTYRHRFIEDRYNCGTSVLSLGGTGSPTFPSEIRGVKKITFPSDRARTFEEMIEMAMKEIKNGDFLAVSDMTTFDKVRELRIEVK